MVRAIPPSYALAPPRATDLRSEAVGPPRHKTAVELKEQLDAQRQERPFIVFRDADDVQRIVVLDGTPPRLAIGRADTNDIPLAGDGQVSRVHAELVLVGGGWTVEDDGLSRNGTFVNGRRLTRRRRLEDGDVIRVGATHLQFRSSGADAAGGTTVSVGADPPEGSLSPAQRRVVVALCRPLVFGGAGAVPASNNEIAAELFLSVPAVKSHLRAISEKFGLDDLSQGHKRMALAVRALESGAVGAEDYAG